MNIKIDDEVFIETEQSEAVVIEKLNEKSKTKGEKYKVKFGDGTIGEFFKKDMFLL